MGLLTLMSVTLGTASCSRTCAAADVQSCLILLQLCVVHVPVAFLN